GSILFNGLVDWNGSFSFIYDSSQTSTIADQSKLAFSDTNLVIGRYSAFAVNEPLAFTSKSSLLGLNNTNLHVSENGFKMLIGTVEFAGEVVIDVDSTSTASA